MTYEIVLSPRAEETFMRLAPHLQAAVETELSRLSQSPVSLSRPAVLPYPPASQLYQFKIELGAEVHYFTILFRYASDEQRLLVIGIGHQ